MSGTVIGLGCAGLVALAGGGLWWAIRRWNVGGCPCGGCGQ